MTELQTAQGKIDLEKIEVGYFSMEIALEDKIPTYSGGLGVLAGDTLRSAADLRLAVCGVTLLYRSGYFRQHLDKDGNQTEEAVHWNPADKLTQLPNKVTLRLAGRTVTVGAWLYVQRGVTGAINPIILLDTSLNENHPDDKGITDQLYGGDSRYRLRQEAVLGIGGARMLASLGIHHVKYHMNEGHSALLTVARFQEHMGHGDADPVARLRDECIFTTHTPVAAGHDQFDKSLVFEQLGEEIKSQMHEYLFHGEVLNMTYACLRASGFVNAVAKKHGEVSRQMFPGYTIDSITNGVHSGFWMTTPWKELFNKHIPSWEKDSYMLRSAHAVPRQEVWDAHLAVKKQLFAAIKERTGVEMNPSIFTIGFARRATPYKRGDLLFTDTNRLLRIAKTCPGIQIVFGGKAHPRDGNGKAIIKTIFDKMRQVSPAIKVVYLEDYDMEIAHLMVAGVDIWLNTPERPNEASGTSGMKAAHNGVPHFSTLDGWWLEGHIEDVTGWSIGPHPAFAPENNSEDVEDLYGKLEHVILPKYYDKRDAWVDMMRLTIAINASFFNTHRMVQQYVANAYFTREEEDK